VNFIPKTSEILKYLDSNGGGGDRIAIGTVVVAMNLGISIVLAMA
jgi:hypothetical protein